MALQQQTGELETIARIVAGEKDLFYSLIQPYERRVYLAALYILENEADAEEVAQEAFLKAFRHLHTFRGEAKFSTWLIQIASNEARMRLRRPRNLSIDSTEESPDQDGDYLPREFADWREIPSEALERQELREALSDAMAALPPAWREVLVLRDVEHNSVRETAEILGISEASVKTNLFRARLRMRDLLAKRFQGNWRSRILPWKRRMQW